MLAPARSEETEAQRSSKARLVRSTRRSTQGIENDLLEEALRLSAMKPANVAAPAPVQVRCTPHFSRFAFRLLSFTLRCCNQRVKKMHRKPPLRLIVSSIVELNIPSEIRCDPIPSYIFFSL